MSQSYISDVYPAVYIGKGLSDEEMIQTEYNALIQDYINSNHRRKVERIEKAFHFARKAHEGVRRRSGEPYIMHPLAIGRIVCREMGLGSTSIVCAILHDVVEDTEYTVDDLRALFGDKVAQIVDGLTKISKEDLSQDNSVESMQAENFRKLILTMNDDVRVILIKIADRLHNMRTIEAMKPASQMKIAGETLYIYAPLAHRLGLFSIKTELEELSFRIEHPQEYEAIKQRIADTDGKRNELFAHFVAPLKPMFDKMGLKYNICTRVKSCYSIWRKMEAKGVPFDEIYDIFAVRIVFESVPDVTDKKICWDIYSDITDVYRNKPDRIRDWLSNPKSNGYQALHLTVMGPDGEWVEVQIRSKKMDDIAEQGFAAHWRYKTNGVEEDSELERWLNTIREILENPNPNAMDFLDTIKLNLYSKEVLIFTPKGKALSLPHGSTALDFAYAVHTDLGNSCIGAKVNHQLVPLSYKLKSGDQVEIITSANQVVKPEWVRFVVTSKAKSKIVAELRKLRRNLTSKGEKIVVGQFEREGQDITATQLDHIAEYFGFQTREEFFYAVGKGLVSLPESVKKFLRENKSGGNFIKRLFSVLGASGKERVPIKAAATAPQEIDRKKPYLLIDDDLNRNYETAPCCNPIPDDEVLGFVASNKVIIHKRSCPEAIRLKSSAGDTIVQALWAGHAHSVFTATVELEGIDSRGLLNAITQSITEDFSLNIMEVSLSAQDGVFRGKIKIAVHNVEEIKQLVEALRQHPDINSVGRVAD